jgi:membrane protein YqaA with SNARE-associated domain
LPPCAISDLRGELKFDFLRGGPNIYCVIPLIDGFFKFILGFGLFGVFILAMLDSTIFFFLPFALDFVLVVLITHHREFMPVYALITVAGSLAGSALTYFIVRKASEETIAKKIPKDKFNKVRTKLKKREFASMLIASLLPPPFPFTPFVTAAALAELPERKTFAAISVGRTVRYFLEGALALVLGHQLLRIFESTTFKSFMFGLFIVAAIGTVISIYKWVRKG